MAILDISKENVEYVELKGSLDEIDIVLHISKGDTSYTIIFSDVKVKYGNREFVITRLANEFDYSTLQRYYPISNKDITKINKLSALLYVYYIVTGDMSPLKLLLDTLVSTSSTVDKYNLLRFLVKLYDDHVYSRFPLPVFDLREEDFTKLKEVVEILYNNLQEIREKLKRKKRKIVSLLEEIQKLYSSLKKYEITLPRPYRYGFILIPFDNYLVITTEDRHPYSIISAVENAINNAIRGEPCVTVKALVYIVHHHEDRYFVKEYPYWKGIKVTTLYKILTGRYKPNGKMCEFKAITIDKFVKILEYAYDTIQDDNCRKLINIALKYAKLYMLGKR